MQSHTRQSTSNHAKFTESLSIWYFSQQTGTSSYCGTANKRTIHIDSPSCCTLSDVSLFPFPPSPWGVLLHSEDISMFTNNRTIQSPWLWTACVDKNKHSIRDWTQSDHKQLGQQQQCEGRDTSYSKWMEHL